jgi:Flp pilus assembly protein TadG
MWDKIKKCFGKRSRAYSKSESGAAAVEFAFVALPFFMLLCVIIEQGVVMFTEYTLQTAVQDSGRLIRTGQAQAGNLTAAQYKAKICSLASVLMDCGGITVYVASDTNFANLKTKLPSVLDVGVSGKADGTAPITPSYTCGGPLAVTAVVATFDWTLQFGFMSFASNLSGSNKRRLVGFAMFANEPFPSNTACSST